MAAKTSPRRRSARIAGALGNLAVLGLMLLAVAYVLPSLLGFQRYVITGGSMQGTYDKGSVVFEKVVPTSQLRVGDVITYIPPASSGVTNLVTHRIVSAEPGTKGIVYRTKGDANPSIDPWTFTLDRAEQVVVEFDVPHVGWALLYLADPSHRKLVVGDRHGAMFVAVDHRDRATPITLARDAPIAQTIIRFDHALGAVSQLDRSKVLGDPLLGVVNRQSVQEIGIEDRPRS